MKQETSEHTLSLHTPDRVLDAPLLTFELPEIIRKIKDEDIWKMGERNSITLMKSKYMRVVLIALHKEMEINFHQSGNVISLHLIEGKVNFQTEEKSVMLIKGSLLTLHEDMAHTLIAIDESVFLLTVSLCPM